MRIYVSDRTHAILRLQAAIDDRPMTDLLADIAERLPAADLIDRQDELHSNFDDSPEGGEQRGGDEVN